MNPNESTNTIERDTAGAREYCDAETTNRRHLDGAVAGVFSDEDERRDLWMREDDCQSQPRLLWTRRPHQSWSGGTGGDEERSGGHGVYT